MKNIIDRFKKRLRENRGYLIMESAFVYPIMFFILMFLIYMGNMFYLKAKVDAIVTQEAQTYAEKVSPVASPLRRVGIQKLQASCIVNEFKFPIKFIFQDDYIVLDMSVTEESPIVDTPEY
jgi:hypothetical protein